jgi:NCS1 family nucleobase:cation symporter-1
MTPANPDQVEHADGRVELSAGVTLSDPALFNDDLAPVPLSRRTWTTYTYAALWISMAHCIPTYMMASGLIKAGMNWWQALITILLGNVIVLVPILANSHPGTRYGIPFPVFARAAYGVFGANVPAVMRALVACGWFGIQCWIGGHALYRFFDCLGFGFSTLLGATPVAGYLPTEWLCFLLFWGVHILIIYRGMDLLRRLENWAAPYVLVMTVALVVWAVRRASLVGHGLGDLLSQPGKFDSFGPFMVVFVPSVTAMVGFWATLSLNMPDFTRFGRSQREQIVGQVVALPTTMTLFAAMGVLITSASAQIFGEAIWNPVDLGAKFESRWLVGLAELTAVIATLAMNIAANVVSPANDIANLAPSKISFRTGGLVTGIVATLMMPWKLLADSDRYINGWLLGYSGGLGSIAGVLICDYWIIRRKQLNLADLYRRDGVYAYKTLGTNWAAIGATAAGCAVAWIGLLVPALHVLYDAAWFTGSGTSAAVYLLAMRRDDATTLRAQKMSNG